MFKSNIKINPIIHIISLNVPYPPNYGGIIDIFYKIKALHEVGAKIHLHCFDYGRGMQMELNKYCQSVSYYKRNRNIYKQFSSKPFIVSSRSSKKLLTNLLKDNYPILFEGLHTTFFIDHSSLADRIKVVRTHNVEHLYYKLLQKQEPFFLRRWFFAAESRKLEKYQSILSHAQLIAAISPNDTKYFISKFDNTFWLPPFHSNSEIKTEVGSGNYALYHGNLSVRENIEAVLFLIDTFKETQINLIVTGKNPSIQIRKNIAKVKNIKLIANPSYQEMMELILNAHIHLLPTFQATGIKLKLIESLFMGRHCIVNFEMLSGTGLEKLCHLANSKEEFLNKALKLMSSPFENKDLIMRKEILSKKFSNNRNAQMLLNAIKDSYLQIK
ncbi:MAG: glycosyltransferase [Salinivirgaceae bacterium]|nr:glycosyltransferase [Salinivirgaceae bacterium]